MRISNFKPCKCGCGEAIIIKSWHKYQGVPKFIKGHSSRMPGHFIPTHDVKHSDDAKKKMSDAKKLLVGKLSPRFGKKLSEESKRKIGLSRIGKPSWNRGVHGVVFISEETRKKMSAAHSGENNNMFGKSGPLCPAWKGGISSLRDTIEGTLQYKKWRNKVYKRDNYRCACCGGNGDNKRGGYFGIHAHHIVTLAEIISDNRNLLEKGDYDIQELFDVNNGVTLCMQCHVELHAGKELANVV